MYKTDFIWLFKRPPDCLQWYLRKTRIIYGGIYKPGWFSLDIKLERVASMFIFWYKSTDGRQPT